MKAYYITYGVFTNDLDHVVGKIENSINIKLIKDGYTEDDEIYYLDSNVNSIVKNFSFIRAESSGYHIGSTEVLYPNYLISCNIIVEDCDFKNFEMISNLIEKEPFIKKMNMDIDEW